MLQTNNESAIRTEISDAQGRRLFWRIVPLLFMVLTLNYIDRQNIGVAALQMNDALGFTPTVFGFGASMFFIGYTIFNIPTALAVAKFGARMSIAAMMLVWGLIAACMAFVWSAESFFAARFLLGIADAGIMPAILLCVNQWFPEKVRGRATGAIVAAPVLAGVIVGPISGALLELPNWLGLAPWQWLFILEAVPVVILAGFVLRYLPDSPAQATWLSAGDRERLLAVLSLEHQSTTRRIVTNAWEAAKDRRVWSLCLIFVLFGATIHSFFLWLPQIVRQLHDLRPYQIGLITALPFLLGCITSYGGGWWSDRTGKRVPYIIGGAILTAIGCAASGMTADHAVLSFAMLTFGIVSMKFAGAPLYALIGSFLKGRAVAMGLAMITIGGSLGGAAGNILIGWLRELTGDFVYALYAMAGLMAVAALLAAISLRTGNAAVDLRPAASPGRGAAIP